MIVSNTAPGFTEGLSPWLSDLRAEVESHPGVNHLLLSRLATGRYTKSDYQVFGLQHYPMVGNFTRYMELLLLRAPSSEQKLWLAKVLVDEYGEGSDGDDHATLYLDYLHKLGMPEGLEHTTALVPEVWEFIGVHLRLCREEPFLVGLGALGPGHEWAIPKMFHQIIPGLERAGVSYDDRMYFDLHTEQDIEHASWMAQALEQLGTNEEARAQVRRGALLSLGTRFRFWTGVERHIVARRQPTSIEAVRRGLIGRRRPENIRSGGDLGQLRAAVENTLVGRPWPVPLPSDKVLLEVAP
ncbi:MAG: iron-containing redox enzyme family protein [Planctomycetota bacterium]|nr:iron-containing redox enzyme family protein [Planctomycetota bacterium]